MRKKIRLQSLNEKEVKVNLLHTYYLVVALVPDKSMKPQALLSFIRPQPQHWLALRIFYFQISLYRILF